MGASEREESLSMEDLQLLHQALTRRTGIELVRGGLQKALDRYVQARMSELGLHSLTDYLKRWESQEEFDRLLDIITVPHTWFFRDPAQIEAIATQLLMLAKTKTTLHIWVPACATGEDAYTLSLLVSHLQINAKITGSDICKSSLVRASNGLYKSWSLRDLPRSYRSSFTAETRDGWRVLDGVKKHVQFEQHNLMSPPLQAESGWDLILCRNVLIYFSAATGMDCAARLGTALQPSGLLFFGAGELIQNPPPSLKPIRVGQRIAFHKSTTAAPNAERAAPLSPQSAQLPTRPPPPPTRRIPQAPPPVSTPQAPKSSAALLFEAHDFEEAARLALEEATHDPTTAEHRMYAGIALYMCHDYENALGELRAAVLLGENLWPAALYLGLCLDSLGAPDQADSEYRHVVRLLNQPEAQQLRLPPTLLHFSEDLLQLAQQRVKKRSQLRPRTSA